MSYTDCKIKTKHSEVLRQCAGITGRSYQSLVDEAMEDFAESYAITYVEEVAEKALKA